MGRFIKNKLVLTFWLTLSLQLTQKTFKKLFFKVDEFVRKSSRVTRFFEKKIAQFFYIYIKALFESPKHFETLKYLQ
jgi:hypothetical protein